MVRTCFTLLFLTTVCFRSERKAAYSGGHFFIAFKILTSLQVFSNSHKLSYSQTVKPLKVKSLNMNFHFETLSIYFQIYPKIKKFLFIVSNSNIDTDYQYDTILQ